MSAALPKSFQFNALSMCLLISSFGVTNRKLVLIITVNIIIILTQITTELIIYKEVFVYVGQPLLMVLDCVAILGPILVHILMLSESLIKKKSDVKIWKQIKKINKEFGANSSSLEKIFQRDFLLMTFVPSLFYIAIILATYRTQANWALGVICNQFSGIIYRWGILMFIYYTRYISDKMYLMAQEIEHLNELIGKYEFACNTAVERIYQMKSLLNLVWILHGLVNTRFEFFIVFYFLLSLCGLTTAMYFLSVRLIFRSFSYTLESVLCVAPYLYTNIHITNVASDFSAKVEHLINGLQLLSDQNWNCPELVSAVKSFKYQLMSAKLSTNVGGHLKVDYSNIVLGIFSIVTTNIFIFLFFN